MSDAGYHAILAQLPYRNETDQWNALDRDDRVLLDRLRRRVPLGMTELERRRLAHLARTVLGSPWWDEV